MNAADYNLLPNFLIIGAAKCGTTTLYDVARQHPGIFMSATKELNFFSLDEKYRKGLEWYQHTHFRDAEGFDVRGEASPTYLGRSFVTAGRIHEAYQDHPLKLIAVFRNPVDRAYSDYWHWVRNAKEDLPFEQALQAEAEWFNAHPGVQLAPWDQRRYFHVGHYSAQLQPFLECFPREAFLFLLTEDLGREFKGTARRMFEFLGADPDFDVQPFTSNLSSQPRVRSIQKSLHNPSTPLRRIVRGLMRLFPTGQRDRWKKWLRKANLEPSQYPPMNEATRRELTGRYREEIEALEGLIGRDLSHWRKP